MIPKKIHYCWIGDKALPESARKCIESWKKFCPDYEIIEWNENNYDFSKNPYMKEALENKKWGFVPDYARLDIVYRYGGIYLDTDVEIIKSFDSLLNNKGFAGFELADHIALGLGFGAEPGNKIIKDLLESYKELHFLKQDGSLNLTPSPEINNKVFVKHGLIGNNRKQILDNCFTIYPTDYFCPKSFFDGITRVTPNTYSIHHYDSSWFTEKEQEEKKNAWKYAQEKLNRDKAKDKKKRRKDRLIRILSKLLGEKNYYLIIRESYKYKQRKKLKNKNISVISSNCNGALILHDLGVRFNSPFVNLWIKPKDYIKLLKDFDRYMAADLSEVFEDGISYPIGKLDDATIYFQHYESFEQAKEKWNERKKRIDKSNLFVLFTDRDGCTYEDLIEFDSLPYNKVVFTNKPYPEIKSSFYIKGFENLESVGHCYEYMPGKRIKYYDQFDYVKWFNEGAVKRKRYGLFN